MSKWYEFSRKDIVLGIITLLLIPCILFFVALIQYGPKQLGLDGEYKYDFGPTCIYSFHIKNKDQFIIDVQKIKLSVVPYYDFYHPEQYDSSEFIIGKIPVDSDTIEVQIKFLKGDTLFNVIKTFGPATYNDSMYYFQNIKYYRTFDSLMTQYNLAESLNSPN